jgi:hypothetical protein
MTLIVGSEGSMGKRYQAILKHLREPYLCTDIKIPAVAQFESADRFIIATPTRTHLWWVEMLDKYNKPILCEKPLSKEMFEVERILRCQSPISMQMQYAWLVPDRAHGPSSYDYFHHGSDGLVWDCFQIIALAKDKIELKEDSPIWKCKINGTTLARGDMDQAYVMAVRAFLQGHYLERKDLLAWHKKVKEFEK